MKSSLEFIIKRPWISEKSTALSAMGKYVFLVDETAKAAQIKQAIEKLYKVHVVKMNVVNSKHGNKVAKKVIVTLKKGESIDIMPQ